jgi:hypothetical protein
MKRLAFLLLTFFAVGSYSGPTWADSIYKCIGANGETSFSTRRCNVVSAGSSSAEKARYAAHEVRLEQLKSERVELKRKLMDLKRKYKYTIAQIPMASKPEYTQQYERQTLSLNAEIKLLDEKQTLLVGQSFDELLQANAGN